MIAMAEGPLQLVPIPGVQQVAKVLSEILKMRTRSNTEEALRLAGRLKALVDLLVSTLDAIQKQAENALGSNSEIAATGLGRSQDLSDRVNRLLKGIESILDEEEALTKGNFFIRFFRSGEDESTLQSLKEQIQEAQLQFQLEGTLKIESGVNELIKIAQTSEWERELNSIRTVDAGYRAPVNNRKSNWLEGTRTALLREIEDWSRGEGLDAARANARIFVLAGGAGTGKSTIAVQVAKFLDEAGALGGSYFFERGVEELSTTRFVFPTLAVQLARSHHNLAPFIVEGIKKHRPKGNTQQLLYTLDELVIEPLSAVHKDLWPSRPIVFVIDALDECSEQEQVPHMLYLLLKRIRSLAFPLRLFLTTRPEYHLQDAFTSDEWKSEPEPFLLTSIPVNVVRDDIKRFIDVRLMDIGIAQKVKAIQDDAVEKLTDAADGLFIYASTAMEFLARYQRDLGKTLALVLNHPLNVDSLDALYDVVLCNAFSRNDFRHPDLGPAIPVVLGVLAVIQDQLPPSRLSSLLQLDLTTLDEVLYRLQSVLMFSEYNPIRLLHASFPQYLANPARCRLPELSNNPSFHGHDYLANFQAVSEYLARWQ
ncbi:hypothetical protein ONZ45_g15220 [Pleurotus djamor]|nr:hypothetical protein ONZ45_g15220 [Pleurotus djamor]